MHTVLSFACFMVSFVFLYLLIGHLAILFEIIKWRGEITIREILFPWVSKEYQISDLDMLYVIHPFYFLMKLGIFLDKCYNFLMPTPRYLYTMFNSMKILDYKVRFKKSKNTDDGEQ